jgi:hypothetical protein
MSGEGSALKDIYVRVYGAGQASQMYCLSQVLRALVRMCVYTVLLAYVHLGLCTCTVCASIWRQLMKQRSMS